MRAVARTRFPSAARAETENGRRGVIATILLNLDLAAVPVFDHLGGNERDLSSGRHGLLFRPHDRLPTGGDRSVDSTLHAPGDLAGETG